MGLFSKKVCSICGGDIGLFGNRKLDDGNLCKDCAAKLSPFFTDRRRSTVAEIANQLAYREANKAEVAAFRVTRALGGNTKVLFDEDAQKFIVTSQSKWAEGNPDVIPFSAVTGCTYRIDEKKTEIQKEEQPADAGASAKNAVPVAAPAPQPVQQQAAVKGFAAQRSPQPVPEPVQGLKAHMAPEGGMPAFRAQVATHAMNNAPVVPAAAPVAAAPAPAEPEYEYSYSFYMTINVNNPYFDTIEFKVNDSNIDSRYSLAYDRAKETCEEIKDVLTGIRQDVRAKIEAAAAPKAAVNCPHCGASTIPDESGRCEYCGSSVF